MDELESKLKQYLKLTEKALKIVKKEKLKDKKVLEILDLAERYFEDAKFFEKKGKTIEAFTAVNYAHAFLDISVRLGLFKVKDNKLFMAD